MFETAIAVSWVNQLAWIQDTVAVDSVVSPLKFEEVTDAHQQLITEAQYTSAMGPSNATITFSQCQSGGLKNDGQHPVTQAQYECDMDTSAIQTQFEAVMDVDKSLFTQGQYCGGGTDSATATQSQFEAVMDVDKWLLTQDQYCGAADSVSVTQD